MRHITKIRYVPRLERIEGEQRRVRPQGFGLIAARFSISDMLSCGMALLDKNYRNYPSSLPLLVYHGDEDQVTWHDASQQFVEKVQANDKQFISYKGYFHECHNEVSTYSLEFVPDLLTRI